MVCSIYPSFTETRALVFHTAGH